MKRACVLAALLAILLPVGCGKKDAGMSGTYKREPPLPKGDVTLIFQKNGTFVGNDAGEAAKGTYKLEGRELTVKTTERNGKPTQGEDAEPITATLSEDGRSISRGEVHFIKQE